MDFKLEANQSMKLSLNLEMKTSIQILKMNSRRLKEYLENESLKNISLEIIETKKNIEKKENFIENISNEENSLIDFLHEQIRFLNIDEDTREALEYLINNLDERGYLVASEDSLRKDGSLKIKVFKESLKILRNLEPSGIGSENLIDCLKNQLINKGIEDKNIMNILENNLVDIADNNFKKIMNDNNLSLPKVENYIRIIKMLNPIPARGYYVNKSTEYIVPDLIIDTCDNDIFIKINDNSIPKIKIRTDINIRKMDIIKALAIEKGIKRRQETLLKVAEYILFFQKDFILNKKTLKSLKIKDIALELDLHESTVSRALKDKYIKIFGKIESLKKYVILNDKVEEIKNLIISLIKNEDKIKPYSDEEILKILKQNNYKIERRTISKYREELGILSSRERKKSRI